MDCCIGVDTGLPHVAASFGAHRKDLRANRSTSVEAMEDTISSVQPTNHSNAVIDVTVDQVITAIQQLFHKADVWKKASRRSIKTPELRTDVHTKKELKE